MNVLDWIRSINPVSFSEAVRQTIFCLALFNLVAWDQSQIMGVLQMTSAIMALFARSNTISTNKLDQKVSDRVIAQDAGATSTGTGTGTNFG